MKAIICGTRENSIGRYIGVDLFKKGWEIFLYSRNDTSSNDGRFHIRHTDLTDHTQVARLIEEVGSTDLVVMSADAGGVFGNFETFDQSVVQDFLDSKLLGSIIFIQELIRKQLQAKVVFLCGSSGPKDKSYMLYGVVNSAIASLVESLNTHYSETLKVYYLNIPVIANSTLAREYFEKTGTKIDEFPLSVLIRPIRGIVDGQITPGFVNTVL